jgi:Gram-negative bacterial TonB protein C-terminal
MTRLLHIATLILTAASGWPPHPGEPASQRALRVALIGFAQTAQAGASGDWMASLRDSLARDERVALIDQGQVRPALAGVQYGGSINMSKVEAVRIGAAVGCDFFVTGKAEVVTRSERERESHEEAVVGVMIVDGRNGELAVFDFILEKASTREAAARQAASSLAARAPGYVARLVELRAERERIRPPVAASEPVEEMPEEGSAESAGFSPPQFLNRAKPAYTEQAARADVTATVEAMAVFRQDAVVGEVEVTRWAGFGLDESAVDAIRSLKFKPAMRDGRNVSVRALIRYNFRRVDDPRLR